MGRPTLREDLSERLGALEQVRLAPSRFNPQRLAFHRGRREFAHFHGPRELDLRLTPARQRDLRGHRLVVPRASRSPWIALRFTRREHLDELWPWILEAYGEAG